MSQPITARDAPAPLAKSKRASNPSVENENLRPPSSDGKPPRPATEPHGSEDSTQSPKTRTDPGSGEN